MPSQRPHALGPRLAVVAECAAVAALYFAVARLALLLSFHDSNATPVWPPSGFALAMLLWQGRRLWPGIAVGAFAANLVSFLAVGRLAPGIAVAASFGITLGNLAEAALASAILRRAARAVDDACASPRDVAALATAGALGAAVAAGVGVVVLRLAGVVPEAAATTVAATWWVGDVVGILVVHPLVTSLLARGRERAAWWPIAATAAAAWLAFAAPLPELGLVASAPLIAALLACVLRGSPRETAGSLAVAALAAIWCTVHGHGPFVRAELNQSLMVLELAVGAGSLVCLTLCAALRAARGIRVEPASARHEETSLSGAAVAVGVAGVLVSTALWHLLEREQSRAAEATVETEAQHLGQRLDAAITASTQGVRRMAARWRLRGGTPQAEWEDDGTRLRADDPWLSAVSVVDGDHVVRWIVPLDDNRAVLGARVDALPGRAQTLARAQATGASLTDFVDLVQGGVGAIVYLPISDRPEDGMLSGVFRLGTLLDGLGAATAGYDLAIADSSGRVAGAAPADAPLRRAVTQRVLDRSWTLTVAPRPATAKAMRSESPTIALCLGTAMTALLAVAMQLAHVANRRSQRLLRANQQLGDERARFRSLVESANAAIITADGAGTILTWNEGATALFGWSADEMVGERLERIVPERHRAAHADGLRRLAAGGAPRLVGATTELAALHRDGREIAIELSLGSWRGEHGPLFSAVIRDVAGRKRAEKQLAEQLVRATEFETLVELSSTPMCIASTDGRFLRINQAWTDLLGWTLDELMAQPYLEFVHPDDRERTVREASANADGRGSVAFENRYRTKDGRWRHLSWTSSVDPVSARVFAVAHDLTSHTELKEDLIRARADAEAAVEAKAAFLATMSHEIRTPMNGVVGMASLLMESPLSDAQREQVQIIDTSAQALLTIIDDILDLSKIEAGGVEIASEPYDPRAVLAEATAVVALKGRAKGLALTSTVDAAVPAALLGDGGRVRQVLLNLLANAVKFTPSGSVATRVAVDGDALRVEVEDTGIGIDPDVMPRLFERFVQADSSTTRRFGGTGLGLAICKSLVGMMGGRIGVEHARSGGSRFWFTLPLRMPATPAPAAPEAEPPSRFDLRVLVAEDNAINRRVAQLHLERLGCRVALAENGAEALAAVERDAFDLVLMDCQMPVMDGYEATRRLRQHAVPAKARMPIVALTANGYAEDAERCRAAGMDDHVAKPVHLDDLRRLLHRLTLARPADPS